MMRIADISMRLHPDAEGIYTAAGSSEVSYATHGHEDCFGIEDRSFWFRHRNRCIASLVRNHPFPGGPFLDIGGGNGYVAQGLTAEGHEVLLLEPGPIGARNARLHRKLEHVACAKVEDAGFVPGSFGAIGMFDVIEHIEHDRAFLHDIAPLLMPGGRLYLAIPCHQWLWSRADEHAGHFRRYTRRSLHGLLEGLFDIDYLGYYFAPLVLPQYLLRALPYRLGFGRKGVLSMQAEHGAGEGIAVRAINVLLDAEARRIAADRQIRFGASALVAATLR